MERNWPKPLKDLQSKINGLSIRWGSNSGGIMPEHKAEYDALVAQRDAMLAEWEASGKKKPRLSRKKPRPETSLELDVALKTLLGMDISSIDEPTDSEDEEPAELSDHDYLVDLAKRLMGVPVMYGIDGYDVDRLGWIASSLKK